MKQNMGTIDRAIRVMFAALVAVLYITGAIGGIAAAVLLGLGAVMAVTSAVSFCPAYLPLHISTKKRESKSEAS